MHSKSMALTFYTGKVSMYMVTDIHSKFVFHWHDLDLKIFFALIDYGKEQKLKLMPKTTYSLRKRYFIQIIKIVISPLTIQWYWYSLNIVLFLFINVLHGNSGVISVARE